MIFGTPEGVLKSCGFLPVGLLRSWGLERVRSCGFDGLTFGAWPTVPCPKVFDCALGPLTDELPGSAGALLLGDVEGIVAEGLLVDGLAVEGELVEPAPEPVEVLEPPELLCAIATPPDSTKATSVAADVTFMVTSVVALRINKSRWRVFRALPQFRWKVPGNSARN